MTPKEFKTYRNDLNLTIKQFALALGKSSVMIWRYEKGIQKIPTHISNFLKSAEMDKIIEFAKTEVLN